MSNPIKLSIIRLGLLMTTCKDYGLIRPKAELTAICRRATPEVWAKFATANKIMRDEL